MNRMIRLIKIQIALMCTIFLPLPASSQITYSSVTPGMEWLDKESVPINAHGGGFLFYNDTYYWFGEHKGSGGNAFVGIRCYSSSDLYNWKNEGVALAVSTEMGSDIESGCKMERPKVIFNENTGKFIMYFHLELKGQGYDAARVGIAVADQPAGPYIYQNSLRPNAGKWPLECHSEEDAIRLLFNQYLIRDYEGGQYSRDMTLFVDDDNKAYHICSSEGNGTIHISELSEDYLSHTGVFARVAPGGYNEAPTIFKRKDRYYMITSGATGWAPNAARLFTATNIMGPWTEFPNPCIGSNADKTFQSQGTFILPVAGKKNAYIYMGDRWNKNNLQKSLYVWLPIQFKNGLPVLQWMDEWSLDYFSNTYEDLRNDLVLAKEFLADVKVGEEIGEYPEEAYNIFNTAIQEIEKITETATEDEIEEAIIALSNAAAALQESKLPRERNTLEDGDYYIKVSDQYYLTNSVNIEGDKPLLLQKENITETEAQVFNITKHPLTGRYKIVSKLDGRNVNEGCRIRNSWGINDHLWRTMNIYYNGSKYAIQTDGKAFGLQWRLDEKNLQIKGLEPFRVAIDNDNDFIFSLEHVSNPSSIKELKSGTLPKVYISSSLQTINVHTDREVNVGIYTISGLTIEQVEIDRNRDFHVPAGLYIVRIQSENNSWSQKVIVK